MKRFYIYGDSIMKATVLGEDGRYHFHFSEVESWYPALAQRVVNRAMMGATAQKGRKLVERDVQKGMEPGSIALLTYGGNDCDFDWAAIAADPQGEHLPHTPLPEFLRLMKEMLDTLRQKGVKPVMMTLPPIDAARYLAHICRDGLSREAIMSWLREVQMIYRHQELYSDAAARLAMSEGVPLLSVREKFVCERDLGKLLAQDGIHMAMPGYRKLFDILAAAGASA